ncbi:hypothetical protein AB1N83_011174 [Pleurotus pulmonarius]
MESPMTTTATQHNNNREDNAIGSESTDAAHVFPPTSDIVSQNGKLFMKKSDGGLIPLKALTPSDMEVAANRKFQASSVPEERPEKQKSGGQDMAMGLQSRPSTSEQLAAIDTVIGLYDTTKTGDRTVLVPVNPVQAASPSVAACLTMFDMDARDKNLRVQVGLSNVQRDQFVLSMGTWGNRILNNVGASYMWTSRSPQTQTGTFSWVSTMESSVFVPWNQLFLQQPQVFLGIQAIDVEDTQWRCKVQFESMSNRGFTFDIHPYGSSNLHGCRLQWIASTDPRIHVGTFNGTSTRVNLKISAWPQIMLGMTSINVKSASTNAGVRLATENITHDGFDIEVIKSCDSELYDAAGSYLVYI